MLEDAEKAVAIVDHAAKQPPLWWLGLLILIGCAMLGATVWFLLRRINRLEQQNKQVRDNQERFLKEQLTERKEETAGVVAVLTKATQVIEQNSRLIEQLSLRLAIAAGHPEPLNLTPPRL